MRAWLSCVNRMDRFSLAAHLTLGHRPKVDRGRGTTDLQFSLAFSPGGPWRYGCGSDCQILRLLAAGVNTFPTISKAAGLVEADV